MTNYLKFKSFIVVTVSMIMLSSCDLDDGVETIPVPDSNLIDLIGDEANLSNLKAALERADLSNTLEGSGPFTLLAPSNTAFNNFLSVAGFASVDDVPVETLRQILLNHVLAGSIDSSILNSLQRNYLETLANGSTADDRSAIYFDAVDGVTFNGTSTVVTADQPASNGVYHVVDAVIDLPTLDTFISVDENFTSFDTALDLISPVSDLPNLIRLGDGPSTVFIPAEQAFQALLDSNTDWEFLSDIDEDVLATVISHHILDGNIRSSTISGNQTAASLEGDDLTFNIVNGDLQITDGSGNEGAIVGIVDIQATNGVIHIISNNVLLPDTSN